MKSFFLQFPDRTAVRVVETAFLEKPFAGKDGIVSNWITYDERTHTTYVGNIYQCVFSWVKWDISAGASMCAHIAKEHLNDLIDKM